MKKILYILFLLLLTAPAFAQKKEISQAREWVKKNQNLDRAEQSMKKLLADSANRNDEKMWLILFEAVQKQYEQGNEKLYLKQNYDTAALFNNTLKMFQILEGLDSVDQSPDKKGRVKLSYRKKHAQLLHSLRPNLYNGGVYFVRKQKYEDAYKFFDAYIDCTRQPLFTEYDYEEKDRNLSSAAYWAVYCGYKMKNPTATLHHTYQALKDTAHYCLMLQYLAETYKLENDTLRYVKTIEEGFRRYPTFKFFFPRLVEYYSNHQQWEEALTTCNEALKADSLNQVFLFAKSTVLLNTGKYHESLVISDSLIVRNDSLADAWLNAGLACFNEGIELDKNTETSRKVRNRILACYQKALPYLERYRQLAPERQDKWALPLYTIYLNLNMGTKFDEIDKLIREKK